MENERIYVRNVQGRYPYQPRPLHSANIETSVVTECRIVRIRIDDVENPEAWLEVTLEIEE